MPSRRLTPQQIAQVAHQAGFRGNDLVQMVSIALAESNGNPNAINATSRERSIGLWQINQLAHKGRFGTDAQLRNPVTNARAAYQLVQGRRARGSKPFADWSVHPHSGTAHSHMAGRHLSAAQAAVRGLGGGGGGSGGGQTAAGLDPELERQHALALDQMVRLQQDRLGLQRQALETQQAHNRRLQQLQQAGIITNRTAAANDAHHQTVMNTLGQMLARQGQRQRPLPARQAVNVAPEHLSADPLRQRMQQRGQNATDVTPPAMRRRLAEDEERR